MPFLLSLTVNQVTWLLIGVLAVLALIGRAAERREWGVVLALCFGLGVEVACMLLIHISV